MGTVYVGVLIKSFIRILGKIIIIAIVVVFIATTLTIGSKEFSRATGGINLWIFLNPLADISIIILNFTLALLGTYLSFQIKSFFYTFTITLLFCIG